MVPDNAPSPITTTSDETIVATLTPKQPQLSKIELGKLRRQYITQGPFEEVIACGHKMHPTAPPKHANCADCWEAFFNVHPGVVAVAQSIVTAFGYDQLVKCNGAKFGKHYSAFVNARNEEKNNILTPGSIVELKAPKE